MKIGLLHDRNDLDRITNLVILGDKNGNCLSVSKYLSANQILGHLIGPSDMKLYLKKKHQI